MELRDYLKIIRARRGLGALGLVIALAAVMALSFIQKPTYHSQSQVIVLEQQNSGAILLGSAQDQLPSQPDQTFVLTQAQVVQSTTIAQKVIDTLRLDTTVAALLRRVTATTDGLSNVVTIDVLDASPAAAARTANAFADAYIGWSRDNQVASIKAAGDQIEKSLADVQAQIAALAKRPVTTSTQSQLRAAETLRASLASKLEQLRINQRLATGSASTLASAVVDPVPASPNHTRDAGLGLAIGALTGLGFMFLAEQMDTRIRSAAEVEGIYGAPVIGTIPTEKFHRNAPSRLTVVQNPGSSAAEAYRSLRVSLDFINFEHEIRTVLVTSAVPREGKSTVAANLSVALAQAGSNVVLLTCDFHRPATSTFFDLRSTVGLSDVLTGARGIGDALQHPEGIERLSVVAAGTTPPNPSELLGSSRMEAIVGSLRESADWIVLDAPPVLAVADTAAVARLADGVIVITRVGVTKREEAVAARDRLSGAGARVLGLVVWGPASDPTASRTYSAYTSH